jgi:hypothetical protein
VGAEDPAPVPGGLTVATQYRAYAGFHGRPGDPFDRLPAARPQDFDLDRRPPATLRQGLDRTDGAFGRVRWAGREVLVGLYASEGSSLRMPLLCVDADGDGTFEGPGEQRRVTGHTSDRGQRWQAELSVEGVPALLEVERVPRLRRVARLDGGLRRLQALEVPPPGGVLTPGGAKADLLARVRLRAGLLLVGALFGEDGSARVGFDLDGDQRLDRPLEWRDTETVSAQPGELAWRAAAVDVQGEAVTLRIEERPARTTGSLAAPGALRGTVTAGGRTLALYLLDRDLDGAFTAHEDLWWFGPLERLARVHEFTAETMVEGDEPAFVGGTAWRIRIVEADGTAHLAPDPQADAASYLARRHQRVEADWARRLEVQSRAFCEANGIDPSRPRAAEPVAWRFATDLEGSLAAARAGQQPVFVVFEADWCQWCRRLSHYTFGDAEVAELLRQFVCVRLNYEFLSSSDYERYGGRGLPFLMLMDPDGRLLERPDRDPCDPCSSAVLRSFEAPHVFVGRLRAALATWAALRPGR